jgi:hypothetical protein
MKTHYLSPTTRKLEKNRIAANVVNAIRRSDPPARFLKEDPPASGVWYEIGDEAAIKKVWEKKELLKLFIFSCSHSESLPPSRAIVL